MSQSRPNVDQTLSNILGSRRRARESFMALMNPEKDPVFMPYVGTAVRPKDLLY